MSKLYDKHFPQKRAKLKYYDKKPWLSKGLRNAIKQKNKLHIKSVTIKSAQKETTYKTHRNELKQMYKTDAQVLRLQKSDMKKTRYILKGIINKKIQSRSNAIDAHSKWWECYYR